jgi:hypothetical protein
VCRCAADAIRPGELPRAISMFDAHVT